MISNIDPTTGNKSAPSYCLKLVLIGSQPPVWRRLQVPGNANLGWLHAVIQLAMGWTNSHLHQFNICGEIYSDPGFRLDKYEDDPPMLNEKNTILMEVLPKAGAVMGYEYDFGDSWEHQVLVEKILPSAPATSAVCLDGSRACPPEDCGGMGGYLDLIKIVKNPKHKEHASMMEWVGGKFDPAEFHLNEVNTCLRKLKWPRVTESQLRKVLMARDGYSE